MPRMFDAANPDNIPDNVVGDEDLIAGYVNGKYKWTDEQWARWDGHTKVEIVIYIPGQVPPYIGDVLDVEAGDVNGTSKAFAQSWCGQRRQAGIRPTIYTSKSGLAVLGDIDCDWWIADGDDNSDHILPGTVATQSRFMGGYDVSTTIDGWPAHKVQGGGAMGTRPAAPCGGIKLTHTGKGYWLFGQDGGVFAYGDAKMLGNPVNDLPKGDYVIGMDVMAGDDGYIMVSEQYNTYSYGSAPVFGHP